MSVSIRSTLPLRRHQSGFTLLMFAVLLVFGLIFAVVNQFDGVSLRQTRDQRTALALARAKEALIAWSVAQADLGARPGNLPCPDKHTVGTSNYGTSSACTSGAIGRLPWKTLGIEELKDGYGESLWYALSVNFTTSASVINSDTRGTLQVYAGDTITLLTPSGQEAAAVVFAPGPALPGQARGDSAAITNYLEGIATPALNNTVATGPFVQGPVADAAGNTVVNDAALALSAAEVIHAVEIRVATTVKQWLSNYYTANGHYPYPATYNDAACLDHSVATDCTSSSTTCRGRFPEKADTPTGTATPDWSSSLPGWFTANFWGQTLYYTVGKGYLKTPAVVPCLPALGVSGVPANVKALVFFAGSPDGATDRFAGGSETTTLANYLIDSANNDGWSVGGDDSYSKPAQTSRNWLITFQ